MSINVGKDGPWYTSKRMWSLGIAALCMILRWAGVKVPYTSEELTAIIYPLVEAAGVALAAWWTLRADRKLTGIPGVTAGDAEKPEKPDEPQSPQWMTGVAKCLLACGLALSLSGCMTGLFPGSDPRTAYKSSGSQLLQCDRLEVNISLPEGYNGQAPTIALFGQGSYGEASTYSVAQQADTAADVGVQAETTRSTQARTGQQTVGAGQGEATGGTTTPTYTETRPITVDARPSVAVTGQGVSQAQAQPATSTQQVIPRSAADAAPAYSTPAIVAAVPDPAIPIVVASDLANMTPEAKAALRTELQGHLDRLNAQRAALNLASEPQKVAQNFLDWQTVTARLKLLE